MMLASACSGSSHVSVPATKPCALGCGRTITLGKLSTFGIAPDGRLVCPKCWQQIMRDMGSDNAPN